MGSNTSKSANDSAVCGIKNDYDVDANPDPRSPTPEITRTPLQGKGGTKHNITKNVDLRKTFENGKGEEKFIHNNPILSAVIKNHLQSYDPRSPTTDFERTPIVISTANDDTCTKNMLLDNCGSPCLKDEPTDLNDSCAEATEQSPDNIVPKNLCNGFFDLTINDTFKEPEEPLGSSTASTDALESNTSKENIPKPMLLETNFVYVEADNIENGNDISNEDQEDQIAHYRILDDDPRSPSIGIERTPIVVAKIEEDSEENVEDMSDDTLIKVLQNTNMELRQHQDKNSDGLLIYEDDSPAIQLSPKKSKSARNSGSRTPLSCMKNKAEAGHARSKSANTLFDPKGQKIVPSKIPKRVSHIPRLKSLSKPTKLMPTASSVSLKNISQQSVISGDCENTPPHSHRDRWDKDLSIVL